MLSAAASSNASPAGLHILVTGNCFAEAATPLATAIQAQSGAAKVTTFDTSIGTPSAATLKAQNLVVSLGDNCDVYSDAATWGNELADYVDHGGAVLQAAYDNWDDAGASPTGRLPPAAMRRSSSGRTTTSRRHSASWRFRTVRS